MFCWLLFVLLSFFLLDTMLSVLLRFAVSDCNFGFLIYLVSEECYGILYNTQLAIPTTWQKLARSCLWWILLRQIIITQSIYTILLPIKPMHFSVKIHIKECWRLTLNNNQSINPNFLGKHGMSHPISMSGNMVYIWDKHLNIFSASSIKKKLLHQHVVSDGRNSVI